VGPVLIASTKSYQSCLGVILLRPYPFVESGIPFTRTVSSSQCKLSASGFALFVDVAILL